jgi:TolB-like protein
VAAAYVVAAWLVIQVAETLFPVYGLEDSSIRLVIAILAVGFLPTLIFAWVFELTPDGLKRELEVARDSSTTAHTGKKLDRVIIGMLALALSYFVFDKFVLSESREAAIKEQARLEARTEALVISYGDKSIAVMPFLDMSAEQDQGYMADGVPEELLNLLAKIPDLRVTSRSSSFYYKGKDIRLDTIAEQLGVANILEGSVRTAGERLRISVRLVEPASGTQLWSENYDRTLEDIFAIQNEIAAAVVEELKISLLGEAPKIRETDPEIYAIYLFRPWRGLSPCTSICGPRG